MLLDIDSKIENWKNKLLDSDLWESCLHLEEETTSALYITKPSMIEIYKKLVLSEKKLTFSSTNQPVINAGLYENPIAEVEYNVVSGDLSTNQDLQEQLAILKSMLGQASLAKEEQGIHLLYLAFGAVSWEGKESPLVFVPVSLERESETTAYEMTFFDKGCVVNPVLQAAMENEFGIALPEFQMNTHTIAAYFNDVAILLSAEDFTLFETVTLGLFPFEVYNLYADLEKNANNLKNHPIIKALEGDSSAISAGAEAIVQYDHDQNEPPIDVFQTLDADTSQLNVLSLAKKGASFVLQGATGTGKTQTISNIISEGLADGKKILFVSEKMASLSGVYEDLQRIGLSKFSLPLFGKMANKKEVLKHLEALFQSEEERMREESLYDLELLTKERDSLNRYVEQLHTPHQPMNKTIYEVNGILARMKNAPNLIFDFKNASEVSAQEMQEFEYLLYDFSKAMGQLSKDYEHNAWHGTSMKKVSHELRQEIEKNSKIAISALNTIIEKLKIVQFERPLSLEEFEKFKELFALCETAKKAPKHWLLKGAKDTTPAEVDKAMNLQTEYRVAKKALNETFAKEIFDFTGLELQRELEKPFKPLLKELKNTEYTSEAIVFEEKTQLKNICLRAIADIDALLKDTSTIQKALDMPDCTTLEKLDSFLPIFLKINQCIEGHEVWYDLTKTERAYEVCTELEDIYTKIVALRDKILLKYEKEIFNINYDEILKRFKVDYTGNLKMLKSSYKEDIKTIKILSRTVLKKITEEEIIELLTDVKYLKDFVREFQTKEDDAIRYLGERYEGETTNFKEIKESIQVMRDIKKYFDGHISAKLQELLSSTKPVEPILNSGNFVSKTIQLSATIEALPMIPYETFKEMQFLNIRNVLYTIYINIDALEKQLAKVTPHTTQELTYDLYKNSIAHLCTVQAIEKEMLEKKKEYQEEFAILYAGLETDWGATKTALTWATSFYRRARDLDLSNSFVEAILSLKHGEVFSQLVENITLIQRNVMSQLQWFNELYEKEYQIWEKPIDALVEQLIQCGEDLQGLEEWIDFQNAQRECEEKGLGDVLRVFLDGKETTESIMNGFKKRFYSLWLDEVIQKYPAVNRFRRKTQEDTLKRFRELDIRQLKIARLRIKDRLTKKVPDINRITSSVDELGILKREFSKQSQRISLMELFAQAPTLLPTLQPCMLMSPFAAASLLPYEEYRFDIVIFDEATRISTEIALSPMLRGEQIIAVGDTYQLPPKEFFYSSKNEELASIFDAMATIVSQQTLKYHYTSENEVLFAFSNIHIYNRSLVTTPTPTPLKSPINYTFVSNGVYDYDETETNENEAKKVAELVFTWMEQFPEKSLGVITVSDNQCFAIAKEITKIRLANPEFELFFTEEKREPFFIKCIEDAQGDLRDGIIFSLAYTKRDNLQNVGFPLFAHDNGEKLLNVAATRARIKMQLVGSIRPTDLPLHSTNVRGIKLLRAYMEFSIHGQSTIETEPIRKSFDAVDIAFEEAVCEFLISNGYRVAKNIGHSKKRVDLAVHHPTKDVTFIMAVSCDGVNYRKSKTARERERAYCGTLLSKNWNFHRVWSTDWIKDPVTEGELLLTALRKAIERDNALSETSAETLQVLKTFRMIDFLKKRQLPTVPKTVEVLKKVIVRPTLPEPPKVLEVLEEKKEVELPRTKITKMIEFDEEDEFEEVVDTEEAETEEVVAEEVEAEEVEAVEVEAEEEVVVAEE
ncbi:MAG: DUF4011 domain-containing protein, partial [Bacillota bacterium]